MLLGCKYHCKNNFKYAQHVNDFITKDFEIIFDTNESDNRFILLPRFDAIIASLSS